MQEYLVGMVRTLWETGDRAKWCPILGDFLEEAIDPRADFVRASTLDPEAFKAAYGESFDEAFIKQFGPEFEVICRQDREEALKEDWKRRTTPRDRKAIEPDLWGGTVTFLKPDPCHLAAFRMPSVRYKDVEMCVNITVTGRTLQRRRGELWVWIRIEFVHDGEPSTYTGGWMLAERSS